MLNWAIAGVPVALYFILIGAAQRRRHPLVTTGWRDLLTLGIACSGLVMIGPMQLFFPMQAGIRWPGWVWVPLLILYFLAVVLAILWSKPRLIVYGISPQQFRESVLQSALELDPHAKWSGEVLDLPHAKIQLAVEPTFAGSVCSVAWIGARDNVSDWLRLERNLVKIARQTPAARSAFGWLLLIAGAALLLFSLTPVVLNPGLAYQQLNDLLLR
jgi:hypothetical protein